MIYYVTDTITSSMRLYYEMLHQTLLVGKEMVSGRVEIPTAVAVFKDICNAPRSWTARAVNLQQYTIMPRGGHFAALEQPELLANDIATFMRKLQFFDRTDKKMADEL